jgi:sugar lactone lactonase YvrE
LISSQSIGISRAQVARTFAIAAILVPAASLGGVAAQAGGSNVSVLASGLNNPRGLTFGPNGQLYVAEGGLGGTTMNTVGQCLQAPPPVGPYTSSGNSASISKIDPSTGARTIVAGNLPSSQTSLALGGLVSGVADVAFVKGRLYALISGAGCSHGLAGTNNAIVRVNADGTTSQVANLSEFLMTHPVANPEPSVPPGDFEPDGTWYSMTNKGDALYALEPNHQELDRIERNGQISRVVDFSKTFRAPADWRGPTVITRFKGSFYVGTLMPVPIVPGSAQVFKVSPGGHFTLYAGGFTTILGIAFDRDGRLYVLEMSNAPGEPTPGKGDIVRVDGNQRTTIASGLIFPTGMTMGPDGNLYVSNFGFGGGPGMGQVLRVNLASDDD